MTSIHKYKIAILPLSAFFSFYYENSDKIEDANVKMVQMKDLHCIPDFMLFKRTFFYFFIFMRHKNLIKC